MTFRAAVVQDSPVLFNLQSTASYYRKTQNNAKLIVFPEAFYLPIPKV